jgi:hypothetical protein
MGYLTSAGANAAQTQHNALNQPGVNFTPQVDWRNVPLEHLEAEMRKKLAIQDDLRKQGLQGFPFRELPTKFHTSHPPRNVSPSER